MSIVDVPFAYTLNAVVRAGTVPRDLAVRATVPVRVDEVGPDEAPVAATMAGRSWHAHGGRLYEAVPASPIALVPRGSILLGAKEIPEAEAVGLRRVDGSDHAVAMAAAQAHAETCLAFGANFLVPSPGPCLSASSPEHGWSWFSRPTIVPIDPRDISAPFLAFGPSGGDAFWDWVDGQAKESRWPVEQMRRSAEALSMTAYLPEASLFDVEGACLVAAARHVFDTGLTNRMAGVYPSAFLEGWLAYRDGSVDTGIPSETLAGMLREAGTTVEQVGQMDEADQRLRCLLRVAAWAAGRWDALHRADHHPGRTP